MINVVAQFMHLQDILAVAMQQTGQMSAGLI